MRSPARPGARLSSAKAPAGRRRSSARRAPQRGNAPRPPAAPAATAQDAGLRPSRHRATATPAELPPLQAAAASGAPRPTGRRPRGADDFGPPLLFGGPNPPISAQMRGYLGATTRTIVGLLEPFLALVRVGSFTLHTRAGTLTRRGRIPHDSGLLRVFVSVRSARIAGGFRAITADSGRAANSRAGDARAGPLAVLIRGFGCDELGTCRPKRA